MNLPMLHWALFAQVSKWSRLGDGLHRSRGRIDLADLIPLAIALVIVAITCACIVVIKKRNDFSKPCNDSQKLFRELSKAHHLNRGNQRLLRELAEAFQLDQPVEVFLQPALFEACHLPQHMQSERDRLTELQQKLF